MSQTIYNKRIAKNTLLLYIRMFITMGISLYTVPIILKTLGVEDYGIYNVIGGIVTLFSFVSNSLASGAQRFLAFEIGKNNIKKLHEVFCMTVNIYSIISLILFIILETGGYWFLNYKMNMPIDRKNAANIVFQFTLFAFIIDVMSIPYNAVVIAQEKMSVFAYMCIFESLLKLISVLLLKIIIYDKLIAYSFFILLTAVIIRVSYQVYCRMKFAECKYKIFWDKKLNTELLSYSGWNIIGSCAIIFRQEGTNILLNLFFGPIVNAAHSLGQRIYGVIIQFINNIYTSTRPQIIKYYASNQEDKMWNLFYKSSKLSFFLLLIISLPVLFEINFILNIWLGKVPLYTTIITRLMIITLLIETIVNQIVVLFQAANKIKKYQAISSIIILLNIPVSYMLLKIFLADVIIPYIVSIVLSIGYDISLITIASKQVKLNTRVFIKKVISPIFKICILSTIPPIIITTFLKEGLYRLCIIAIITVLSTVVLIWYIGLNNNERHFIRKTINNRLKNDNT